MQNELKMTKILIVNVTHFYCGGVVAGNCGNQAFAEIEFSVILLIMFKFWETAQHL